MKYLVQFIFPTIKAIVYTCGFLISIGWAAFASINLIVKAEANVIRSEVKVIRDIDMQHINNRFDDVIREIRELKTSKK